MEKACQALKQMLGSSSLLKTCSAPPSAGDLRPAVDQDAHQLWGWVLLLVSPVLSSATSSVTHRGEQEGVRPMELHWAQRGTVEANTAAPVPYGNEMLELKWAQAMEHWCRETAVLAV